LILITERKTMKDFEEAVKIAAEKAVLEIISSGQWVQPDYANRYKIPADFMSEVWNLIDSEKIKAALAVRLEAELADRIVTLMASEIATDVKQILSVKERREAIRAVTRENLDRICGATSEATSKDRNE